MEQVLVIPKNKYTSDIRISDLMDIVADHGLFIDRPVAETDQNYLQIIPYIIVKKGNMIFAYQRLKKGTESRLHNKYSIGIGGHVNPEDLLNENVSYWTAVEVAAYRELVEELAFDTEDFIIDYKSALIYDPSNDVGKVHLGVIGICDIGKAHVTINETEKISGSFIFYQKLKSLYNDMETWSQIAIDSGVIDLDE